MARKPNPRLVKLRAEVERAEKLTQRKIDRIEKLGINMKNHDPREVHHGSHKPRRIDPSRYNEKQLRSYISKLENFRDRKNQYIPDARGGALRKSDYDHYKALEKKYLDNEYAYRRSVMDIKGPYGDDTLGEYAEKFMGPKDGGYDQPVNTKLVVRKSTNFTSQKSLDKMIKAYEKRARPDYHAKITKAGFDSFQKMAKDIGAESMIKLAKQLKPAQWDIVWNQVPLLARSMSEWYEIHKKLVMGGDVSRGEIAAMPLDFDKVEHILDWAKNLPVG